MAKTVEHELTGLFSGPNWRVRVYAKHEAPKDWKLPKDNYPEWDEIAEISKEEASEECLDIQYAECEDMLVGSITGLSGPGNKHSQQYLVGQSNYP